LAGILDNKSRVIDVIITNAGRRQIASGRLQAKYLSFVDRNAFYSVDADGYLEDPGTRIYFEASSNDDDDIIPETDFDGAMVPFRTDNYNLTNGKVAGATKSRGSSIQAYDSLSASSIDSFRRQMIIGSRDTLRPSAVKEFTLGSTSVIFYVTDQIVSQSNGVSKAYVDDVECIFQDYRFGNFDNYKFLPPLDRPIENSVQQEQLATYTQINEDPLDTLEELENLLSGKQKTDVDFTSTSQSNNLLGQVFEHSESGLQKLSIVDGGQYESDDGSYKQVYFVGKLYRDSADMMNFINIFTLVFENA
jgi:hypothetical protein